MVEHGYLIFFEHQSDRNCHHNPENGAEEKKNCRRECFVEEETAHPASNAANEHQWVCPGNIADEIAVECAANGSEDEERKQITHLTY